MKKKILIADDSKTFLLFEELLLSELICDIVKANNGVEAFQKAQTELPDLILLDIHMPELNGIECCRLIKSNPATSRIPVIIVTAHGNERNSCIKAGCTEIITKPVDKKNLITLVRKHL
jgi:CheY-like chemotaxis protein